jgi:hypothetical protein
MGRDMRRAGNDVLSQREVDAVVKFLFGQAAGRGPATYEDCVHEDSAKREVSSVNNSYAGIHR